MQKSLYLVCPLGFAESYIQRKFGLHHYFLTALGSVFRFQEVRFVEAVVEFLKNGPVAQIILVHNLDCPLKKKIINHSRELDSYAEKELFELYIDHYYQINPLESEQEKVRELALLHIGSLCQKLARHPLIEGVLREEGIGIGGMLIDPPCQKLEAVPVEAWKPSAISIS